MERWWCDTLKFNSIFIKQKNSRETERRASVHDRLIIARHLNRFDASSFVDPITILQRVCGAVVSVRYTLGTRYVHARDNNYGLISPTYNFLSSEQLTIIGSVGWKLTSLTHPPCPGNRYSSRLLLTSQIWTKRSALPHDTRPPSADHEHFNRFFCKSCVNPLNECTRRDG